MDADVKKRLCKALGVVSGALLLLVGYALFFNIFGFGLPCMFQRMLGIECAGCGLSRAAAALLRLDLRAAFSYNAVWPLYVVYALWALPATVIPYVREGRPIDLPRPLWLNYVIFGLILAYGVVRNFL